MRTESLGKAHPGGSGQDRTSLFIANSLIHVHADDDHPLRIIPSDFVIHRSDLHGKHEGRDPIEVHCNMRILLAERGCSALQSRRESHSGVE